MRRRTSERAKILVEHARRMFPAIALGHEVRYWMGFRPSTPDSLPILGQVTGHPGLCILCSAMAISA